MKQQFNLGFLFYLLFVLEYKIKDVSISTKCIYLWVDADWSNNEIWRYLHGFSQGICRVVWTGIISSILLLGNVPVFPCLTLGHDTYFVSDHLTEMWTLWPTWRPQYNLNIQCKIKKLSKKKEAKFKNKQRRSPIYKILYKIVFKLNLMVNFG